MSHWESCILGTHGTPLCWGLNMAGSDPKQGPPLPYFAHKQEKSRRAQHRPGVPGVPSLQRGHWEPPAGFGHPYLPLSFPSSPPFSNRRDRAPAMLWMLPRPVSHKAQPSYCTSTAPKLTASTATLGTKHTSPVLIEADTGIGHR